MNQERKDIYSQLIRFASPLGPMVSFDEMIASKQAWHDALNAEALPYLIEILVGTSFSDDVSNLSVEDLLGETAEALDALATSEGELVARAVCEAMGDSSNKNYLIKALGSTNQTWVIPDCLKPLLDTDLSTKELISVVSTLGELGGAKAQELLSHIEARFGENEEIRTEIQIARAQPGI